LQRAVAFRLGRVASESPPRREMNARGIVCGFVRRQQTPGGVHRLFGDELRVAQE